jgi:hypothetical protein
LAQKSPEGASTPAAAANGNSAINKKRKKDGLKPIITTEGPGYVHLRFLPCCKDRLMPCFSCPPFSRRSITRSSPACLGSPDQVPVPSTWRTHIAQRVPSLSEGGGVRQAGHGTHESANPWRGKAHYLRTHALTLRHHTAQAHGYGESPSSKGQRGGKQPADILGLCPVAQVSLGVFNLALPLPPESSPLLTASRLLPQPGGQDTSNLSLRRTNWPNKPNHQLPVCLLTPTAIVQPTSRDEDDVEVKVSAFACFETELCIPPHTSLLWFRAAESSAPCAKAQPDPNPATRLPP